MKHLKKLVLTTLAVMCLVLCLAVSAFAANQSITFRANADDANTVVRVQENKEGKDYLFLPSSADLKNLVLSFSGTLKTSKGTEIKSGVAFDLTALATAKNGVYTLKFSDGSELNIMKSANVRTLFYVSDDPENAGRAYVDAVKGNASEGNMSLIGTDGDVDYTDKVTELKGRGNSTFAMYAKKPYQIKIKNKTALIEGSAEKSKKYVLLADAADYTLMHNAVTFALADALGMPYTNGYEHIDLYFDGEYRGTYLITEKVEVASTNVDIDDLDEAIEEANAGSNAYENPVVVTKTTASKGTQDATDGAAGSYKYIDGLVEPALPEGASHHAYLLEYEFAKRYGEELTGFVTKRGKPIITKNPEYLTKETGAFISAFWQEFEDAVYGENGYNATTGKYYYDYCDLDSLVNLYLINELSKNHDTFYSSAFFYLPADEDKFYVGPVWDFDIGYGNGYTNRDVAKNPEYFYAATRYLIDRLMTIESFRDAVKATLDSETGDFYLATQKLLGSNGVIAQLKTKLNASQKMNYTLWDVYTREYYIESDRNIVVKDGKDENYDNAVDFLHYFIDARIDWLSDATSQWNGSNYSLPLDPEPEKELSFFERIAAFFRSIIEWFANLFK